MGFNRVEPTEREEYRIQDIGFRIQYSKREFIVFF